MVPLSQQVPSLRKSARRLLNGLGDLVFGVLYTSTEQRQYILSVNKEMERGTSIHTMNMNENVLSL